VVTILRREYEAAGEAREHTAEKKRVLEEAYSTLKRDIYLRKQNHKLSMIS
jgi:hypothetical protein